MERVRVPAGIPEWKRDEATRERALAAQAQVRTALAEGFGRGLSAKGYEVDAEGNGAYLLAP